MDVPGLLDYFFTFEFFWQAVPPNPRKLYVGNLPQVKFFFKKVTIRAGCMLVFYPRFIHMYLLTHTHTHTHINTHTHTHTREFLTFDFCLFCSKHSPRRRRPYRHFEKIQQKLLCFFCLSEKIQINAVYDGGDAKGLFRQNPLFVHQNKLKNTS
jgi:hypothetical protein